MYVLAREETHARTETHTFNPSTDNVEITNQNPALILIDADDLPPGYSADDITAALTNPTAAADTFAVTGITGTLAATFNITYTVASATLVTSGADAGKIQITTTSNLSGAASSATDANAAADTTNAQFVWTNNFHSEEEYMYPADRCTWETAADDQGTGYVVQRATYYNGASSTGTDLGDTVRLGYIGKSGRFVEIAG